MIYVSLIYAKWYTIYLHESYVNLQSKHFFAYCYISPHSNISITFLMSDWHFNIWIYSIAHSSALIFALYGVGISNCAFFTHILQVWFSTIRAIGNTFKAAQTLCMFWNTLLVSVSTRLDSLYLCDMLKSITIQERYMIELKMTECMLGICLHVSKK